METVTLLIAGQTSFPLLPASVVSVHTSWVRVDGG